MNILELDSYNLGDAVKFNKELNPRIWEHNKMRPEVHAKLLEIAEDFKEFLGLSDLEVKDITVSGSNAGYSYTPYSDIDLHLVVDIPKADSDDVYRELFDAKKYQYNELHNIKIGGYEVELYVENANKPPVSQGMYSVLNNDWINIPRQRRATVDDDTVRSKYEDLKHRIDSAVDSNNVETITRLAKKIKDMRQAGLDAHGELGPENLAYKMLRTQNYIQKLYDAQNRARDTELSLKEKAIVKPKTTYGFKTPTVVEAAPESVADKQHPNDEQILKNFIKFCVAELKIEQMPTIKLRRDPQWPVMHKTFGRYINDEKTLEVAFGQRHIMDVLRTVAHELTHKHQHEREGERMGPDAGETGSPYENEANARAGILMRDYGRLHPELFDNGETKLGEGASGYIPTKAQAKDPRYSMALTVDIKPGQVGKEANKLKLRTDKQGHPQIARANGLFEKLALEFSKFKNTDEDYSPDTPPGPESKPTMPKGTVRVDVSDVYDWYKLGQHISNMDGLGQHDFGKGPPSSIISFGSEEEEHKFIDNLKKTGLDVTDIDPIDPRQPPGMKKIKTDPTYNVDETLQAPISKSQDAEQYYRFIMGKHKLGRALTRQEQEYVRTYQLFKRQQVSESIEQLDEVRMSPSNLQQWANSDAAQGIRAGFEAELIFRDTTSDENDGGGDMEPDYDMDERCRSIQGIIDFFQDGDYGGMSSRQENALREGLDEQYMEWHDEAMYDAWRDERDELIKEAWLREKPMDERIHAALVDGMDLTDEQADAIEQLANDREAGKIKGSEMSEEQLEMTSQYSEARQIAEDILQEDVEQTIEKEDGFYDEVLDEFRDGFYTDDDSGFFSDVGLVYMSDVANSYDLDWPYMTGSGGNDGTRTWDEIGDSLHDTIDMPVKVSSGYHSATRKEGLWIVEPDSSLEPDDREDYGLEIVSPPMPLLTALEKLQEVTDWANDTTEGNAYTNSSTGLHMGVSVPFKGGDVDYLKLVLFLGDEYVLQQFGREANTYTKSAMSKFKENIKGGRTDPMSVLKLMQHGLLELAQREVQKGVGEGKYTSVHVQKGYIEFRSAGGDWLAEESADPEKLSSTMLRYARAMSIAANPAEERREYAKKLYKLIAPEGDSQLALFSQFAAGELTAEQLKKQWAEKTIGIEKKMNQRWKLFKLDKIAGEFTPVPGAEWNGYTEDQVKNAVWSKYGREALDSGEYELRNMSEGQQWEVYDVNTGDVLEIVTGKNKGEVADKVWDKYNDQKIPFNVRPYEDPATMTPRAKLAQRIAKPKPETGAIGNWQVARVNDEPMGEKHVFNNVTKQEAEAQFMKKYPHIFPNGRKFSDTYKLVPIQATTPPETQPNVAQNFPTQSPEQARTGNGVPIWELYDKFSNSALYMIINPSTDAAWKSGLGWLRDHGAEDPATYTDRFGIRPKINTVSENFADGKNPQDKGDSVRHGIPKGATIAQLEKAAKAPGRKGQLARWQLNMRRGKKK